MTKKDKKTLTEILELMKRLRVLQTRIDHNTVKIARVENLIINHG